MDFFLKKGASFFIVFLLLFFISFFYYDKFLYFFLAPVNYLNETKKSIVDFFKNRDDLLKENQRLKKEVDFLNSQLVLMNELKQENALLRKQLNLNKKDNFLLKEAKITGLSFSELNNVLLIDKGILDGISQNMPVIFPGNILVGSIKDVFDDRSTVIPITDKNSKIAGALFDPANKRSYKGVVSGYFQNMLFMDLIDKESSVIPGDIIITSGIDKVYPYGLFLGRVEKVIQDDNAPFKQAILKPDFLNKRYSFVFIILR